MDEEIDGGSGCRLVCGVVKAPGLMGNEAPLVLGRSDRLRGVLT